MNDLKTKHPEWYHATDYHWLKDHEKWVEKYNHRFDNSDWNKLDDLNHRDMSNWDDHGDEN